MTKSDKILLGHGSGGRLMHELIREFFAPAFGLEEFNDSAIIDIKDPIIQVLNCSREKIGHQPNESFRLAFTTDSYVVSPIFFPGGNIGELAVNGTVNDLSMVGARPLYLSSGFILEEGLPVDHLKAILMSMAQAAKTANIRIVAGDTKVVNKGKGDSIFINMSGIGVIYNGIDIGPRKISEGDKVIVSGMIGNHGVAVLSERNGLTFEPPVLSDTAPLNGLVEMLLYEPVSDEERLSIKMMRDPTRGGIATTLKEIALESGSCITIDENLLPISDGVRGACDLLGLDPLYIANEGIFIAIVSNSFADLIVQKMRTHLLGKNAKIIGEVSHDKAKKGMVLLKTAIGGVRVLDMLSGEQLPRIC